MTEKYITSEYSLYPIMFGSKIQLGQVAVVAGLSLEDTEFVISKIDLLKECMLKDAHDRVKEAIKEVQANAAARSSK